MILRLILALVGATIAFAQNAAVGVQVYDYTNLEPNVLRHFLASTQNILAGTGMSVQVELYRGKGALSREPAEEIVVQSLIVRILANDAEAKSHSRGTALGRSYAGNDGGSIASIFLAPVRDQAAAANVPWDMVLSYAAAHEVGHLLLGVQAHTPRGVMKAHWDRSDYLDMFQNRCHFTRTQAAALAGRYGSPVTLSASLGQEEGQ
jgi:hypothetical protein